MTNTPEMFIARRLIDVLDRARKEIESYRFEAARVPVHEVSQMLLIIREELAGIRASLPEESPAGRAS